MSTKSTTGPASEIQQAIKRAVDKLGLKIKLNDIQLEHPALEEHGDYSTNVALKVISQKSKVKNLESHQIGQKPSPKILAENIVELLKQDKELLQICTEKIEIAGPGFINFHLKPEYLLSQLQEIEQEKENYGHNNVLESKKIMVEYAHPNTHKELHIGHMRTLVLGESLSRVLEASGAEIYRANYQGDIGPHVAKAVWGTKKLLKQRNLNWEQAEKFSNTEKAHLLGEGYVLANKEYQENKTEIDQLNKKIYNQDPEEYETYLRTRQWSLDYYYNFYQRFGTFFNKLYFESQVVEPGKQVVLDNIGKVFEKSQGAVIFNGEKHGLHNRVFLTQDGNPTYEGKDMGLAPMQMADFPFDKLIHVVANEQAGYFQVVIKALELIHPELQGKEFHLSMGMVNLVGQKMSSRTGVIVTVDGLLEDVKQNIRALIKEGDLTSTDKDTVAEQVTLGAVKYTMLKVNPAMNVAFDLKKSIDIHGNSGPYLQYAHARCRSVLEKAEEGDVISTLRAKREEEKSQTKTTWSKISPPVVLSDYLGRNDRDPKLNPEELSVLRYLYRFPEVVLQAATDYAPNHICTYLHDLAQRYNTFYNQHSILTADNEDQKNFRLLLTSSVAQVLRNGLQLLGIDAPYKM